MSKSVFRGFVGRTTQIAYTREGEKVLSFDLGWQPHCWVKVALFGDLAQTFETIVKPGMRMEVAGELVQRASGRGQYFKVSRVLSPKVSPPQKRMAFVA